MLLKQHAKVGDPTEQAWTECDGQRCCWEEAEEVFVMESSEGARTRRGQTANGGLRPEQEVGGGGAVV